MRSLTGILVGLLSLALLVAVTPVSAGPPPTEPPTEPPIESAGQGAEVLGKSVSIEAKPVVYLTFDDGPYPATVDLLALLESYDIKATFFVTGQNVLHYPDTALHAAVNGHAIANHTFDHAWLTRTDPSRQLTQAQEIIESVTGISTTCYRPPYGATSDEVRRAGAKLGLTEWLWDLDTNDWRGSVTTEQMIRSLDQVATFEYSIGINGTNVLMHDGGDDGYRTVEAMTIWLEANHDLYDFRLIEGCGGELTGQPGEIEGASSVRTSTIKTELSRYQTSTLFDAFISQGIDVEAWDLWRQSWQDRILAPAPADA